MTTTDNRTPKTNHSRTGKVRKAASNALEAKSISNGRQPRAVPTGPVKAALTGQILIRKGKIWTARPKIDHVVIFQASAPRISNAAALIVVAVGASVVIVSAVEASAAATIALVVAVDLAAAALADSAVAAAGSGTDGEN